MVGKIARDKPYKSKFKVSREAPKQYSLRQRNSISYNEAVLSCMNAVLDDNTGLQECDKSNATTTCDTRDTTLNNGANKDQTQQNKTTTSSNKMESRTDNSGTVIGNPLDLSLKTKGEKSLIKIADRQDWRDARLNSIRHSFGRSDNIYMGAVCQKSNFREGNVGEEMDKISANISDDELDNSSWDSESDSISYSDMTSDTLSDGDDDEMLKTGRTPLTHLKSGQVNRLMSICTVCGAGFCRRGDLNAHMNLVHHQTVQNYKDLWSQRIQKRHDTQSMPLLKCEDRVNSLPNQQKCENSDIAVHTMPKLQCELGFIPDLSKHLPGIPKQNIEMPPNFDAKCETLQNPVQKCEAPLCQLPSMPMQTCATSENSFHDVSKFKCEGSTNQVTNIPPLKCEGSTCQAPNIPPLKYEGSTSQTPNLPPLKCEGSTSQTPNLPPLKCEGSTSQTPNLPLQKCKGSTNKAPNIPPLKCEGSTSQTPNIPLQKCEGSTNKALNIPLLKCEGSTSQTPNIPPLKCESSTSQTPNIPLHKCEGSTNKAPNIPLLKCEGSTSQTPEIPKKCETSIDKVKKMSQNCNTVENHESLLQSKYEVTDDSTDLDPYQQLAKCEASYTGLNTTTQPCAVLSESNVHKWNIYNKDVRATNGLQRAAVLSSCSSDQRFRNGNILQMSDQISITTGPFSLHGSSTKLCPSRKENIGGFDKNGNVMNMLSSLNHCAESQIVSNIHGIQRQDPAKISYVKKQDDKENLCGHESNLQIWMDKSMAGRVNTSTSLTASSSASDGMDTLLSRSSESSFSSLSTFVSKYDDYMVLPGRQNVKLSHRLQKCQTCGKGFSRLSDLKLHSSTHDPERQRSTDCPTNLKANNGLVQDGCLKKKSKCGRGRPRKNNSQNIPSGICYLRKEGPLSGREKKGGLQTAQTMRKNECESSLKQKLRRGRSRMKVDSLTKPSNNKVCPVCKRFFNTNGSLQAHVRVHTGERPFECKQCNKSFSQKGNLKIHMWIHTQERPYKCSACSSSYNQLNLLLYHQWKKHGKEPGKKSSRQNCSKN